MENINANVSGKGFKVMAYRAGKHNKQSCDFSLFCIQLVERLAQVF